MFVIKDDVWGIRKMLKKIYFSEIHFTTEHTRGNDLDNFLEFNIFFNQFLPPTYRETLATVIRHSEQIKSILRKDYDKDWVWLKRPTKNNPKDLSCANMGRNDQTKNEVKDDIKYKNGKNLPNYLEIEETKKLWQSKKEYNKEMGFSNPIKEEYVQLRVIKKGVKNK